MPPKTRTNGAERVQHQTNLHPVDRLGEDSGETRPGPMCAGAASVRTPTR